MLADPARAGSRLFLICVVGCLVVFGVSLTYHETIKANRILTHDEAWKEGKLAEIASVDSKIVEVKEAIQAMDLIIKGRWVVWEQDGSRMAFLQDTLRSYETERGAIEVELAQYKVEGK